MRLFGSLKRICGKPAPANRLAKYGVATSTSRAIAADVVSEALGNVERVFRGGLGQSRYSDGSWPVLYSGSEDTTAMAEKGYWVLEGVFAKGVRPDNDEVNCVEFTFSCKGKTKSLVGQEKANPMLVHPTNYSTCVNEARSALAEGYEVIEVPSARRRSGINVNLFSKTALENVINATDVVYRMTGGKLTYHSGSFSAVVVIDDVYATLV